MRERVLVWRKEDGLEVEFARVEVEGRRLRASGITIATEPLPYRLDYTLATLEAYVTARLSVAVEGEGWRRSLVLQRHEGGEWTIDADSSGDAGLPEPGGDPATVAGAVDCDLGRSPLTNTMPVLRHSLTAGGGPVDFLMAWVSVPDLRVLASHQTYRFVARRGERRIVRYQGRDRSFEADLEFDQDGFVVRYPDLAELVRP